MKKKRFFFYKVTMIILLIMVGFFYEINKSYGIQNTEKIILQYIQWLNLENEISQLQLVFSKPIKTSKILILMQSSQLNLILPATVNQFQNEKALSKQVKNNHLVKAITVKKIKDNIHITLDLKETIDYQLKQEGSNLRVNLFRKLPLKINTFYTEKNNHEEKIKTIGKRISLNFQDIKIRALLQIIAEFTGLNIISSDQVKGHITLRLKDIPWEQALDIILKSQGLSKRQYGNVYIVGKVEEIASHEKQDMQAQQQLIDLEPVQSILIPLNYSKATDMAILLKDKTNTLLSARGVVSADIRTNTLWVQDIPKRLQQIRDLIQHLDIPIKQVLIEARIVTMDKRYQEDIGIRFGINQPGHLGGNLEAANNWSKGIDINPLDRLNMNLPVTPNAAGGNPATLGLAMMRLGQTSAFLDLELSALETEGGGQVLSSPRLLTANQQVATIQSGEEIPYQESTSSGATSTSFKKAVLSLSVTPQITPDNCIILDLKVNQDKKSTQTYKDVPVIETREITTKVLVNNGETIVLGGIYEQTDNKTIRRIPFLGKLPILGVLFRNTNVVNERKELLIFITPTIIEQDRVEVI